MRQVSVRKAALAAAAVMAGELPSHAPAADLWVAVALPLVRCR